LVAQQKHKDKFVVVADTIPANAGVVAVAAVIRFGVVVVGSDASAATTVAAAVATTTSVVTYLDDSNQIRCG